LKRLSLPILVLVALAATPSLADARSVAAKRVRDSHQAVIAYWTADRMRSAKPVERAKGGGSGQGSTYPFTSSEVPAPYNVFPTSTNGKVFFTDGGVNYTCSGTALTSGNESVVWTAGHCVHDGNNDFHGNWVFVPAYRDGLRPYGTFAARALLTTSGWQDGDFAYDLGAAAVSPAGGATLTDTTGGRDIAFNYSRQQQYKAYGYPAAKKFSGQRLRVCDAPWALNDTNESPATMGIGCDHTGGSSGGGWIVGNAVYSVNSYGYNGLRNVMFGPYQGAVAQQLYTNAAAS
jgi:V8-like Glu-specific endopeptidase